MYIHHIKVSPFTCCFISVVFFILCFGFLLTRGDQIGCTLSIIYYVPLSPISDLFFPKIQGPLIFPLQLEISPQIFTYDRGEYYVCNFCHIYVEGLNLLSLAMPICTLAQLGQNGPRDNVLHQFKVFNVVQLYNCQG